MPIYSGFINQKLEHEYNKFLQRMLLLLVDQITL